jgi:hypothetical protein
MCGMQNPGALFLLEVRKVFCNGISYNVITVCIVLVRIVSENRKFYCYLAGISFVARIHFLLGFIFWLNFNNYFPIEVITLS